MPLLVDWWNSGLVGWGIGASPKPPIHQSTNPPSIHSHLLSHRTKRLARQFTTVIGARRERIGHDGWLCRELLRARAYGHELGLHQGVENFLALDAPPAGGGALHGHMLHGFRRTERLVQLVAVTGGLVG